MFERLRQAARSRSSVLDMNCPITEAGSLPGPIVEFTLRYTRSEIHRTAPRQCLSTTRILPSNPTASVSLNGVMRLFADSGHGPEHDVEHRCCRTR